MTDHLADAEQSFINATRERDPDVREGMTLSGFVNLCRHLRASQPATETAEGSESPGARGFWVVELESTDENDPGWFTDGGGAGDDKLVGYHVREEAEKKGQESVGLGYRWRVVWVAPANRRSSFGEDNAPKPKERE